MVACYSMVAAVLVKKPVMVGKVASGACSFKATSRFSRVQISSLEGKPFVDRYTNKN